MGGDGGIDKGKSWLERRDGRSDPLEFVGIDIAAVPLADIEVAGGVDADVVTIFEDGLGLDKVLEFAVLVSGGGAARI